jgi:hypothetical protein
VTLRDLKHRRDIVDRSVTTGTYDHDFTHVLAVVDQKQLQHPESVGSHLHPACPASQLEI